MNWNVIGLKQNTKSLRYDHRVHPESFNIEKNNGIPLVKPKQKKYHRKKKKEKKQMGPNSIYLFYSK